MYIKKLLTFFLFWLFCSSLAFANDCKLTEFKKYADNLDKTKIESVELLTNKYRELTINQSKKCTSKLFGEFWSYYYQFMESYEKKTLRNTAPSENSLKKIKKEINKVGWKIYAEEGALWIDENGSWFIENFGNSLPDDWKKFLQQRKKEKNEGFEVDAVMLIPWDELRLRIIYWEDFLKIYPSFQEKSTVERYLSFYFPPYLTGMSDSRIYDFETKKVYEDVIKSYENFIKINKKSKYHKIVEDHYNILKKNSFVISYKTLEELVAFYKANKFESSLSDELRAYQPYKQWLYPE